MPFLLAYKVLNHDAAQYTSSTYLTKQDIDASTQPLVPQLGVRFTKIETLRTKYKVSIIMRPPGGGKTQAELWMHPAAPPAARQQTSQSTR
jgi:hypothetical protein